MPDTMSELVDFARRMERARHERALFISPEFFGEPGWSLMLDLYIAHHEGRVVNTSGACFGANIPQTTGLRWIEKLASAGLIVRHPHPQDTRFVMIQLSADGLARMTALLNHVRTRLANGTAHPSQGPVARNTTI